MQDVMWCDRMGGGQSNRNRKQNNRPASDFRPDCTRHNTSTGTRIAYRTPYISRPGRLGGRWDCEAVALHATRQHISGPRGKERQANKRSQQGQTNKKGTHTRQHQHTHSRGDHRRERDKAWGGSVRWRALRRKREAGARGPAWQSTVRREVSGQVRQCCDLVGL